MNLRLMLKAQGVSPSDIDEAVENARKATRVVQLASGALVEVFTRAASRVKNERAKLILVKSTMVIQKVNEGAATLLRKQ
jgi:hypothetical protein